jgi:hypothetical protein
MAKSLNELRNSILTSVYGRRLGLDPDEFVVGQKALKMVTQSIGSSTNATASNTGTQLLNYGITRMAHATEQASTGSSYGTTEVGGRYSLAAPAEGVEKIIYTASHSSTQLFTVEMATGVFIQSSAGSTFGGIGFAGPGAYVRLIGISTAKWLLAGFMSTILTSLAAT